MADDPVPGSAALDDLVPLTLVPVQVFGTDDCCEHGDNADCPASGFGLMDAVSAWSDCNRAEGRIYRLDDLDSGRLPGDTITVYVRREDVPWFERRFGEESNVR